MRDGAPRGMTWARLLWFDFSRGNPQALRILLSELGALRCLELLPRLLWLNLTRDPFKALGQRPLSREDRFSRHQLKPVLLLDAALTEGLGLSKERAGAILGRLIAEIGATFIGTNLGALTPELWGALDAAGRARTSAEIMARFFNMEAHPVAKAKATSFAFDVTACRFAALTRALGRPELAELYCEADRVYFEDPEVPIRLERHETIAGGGARCDFHFHLERPGDASLEG